MYKIHFITLLLFFFFISACEDEVNSNIPSVPFYVEIDLTRPQYAGLLSDGSAIVLPPYDTQGRRAGYAGLIIVNSPFDDGYFAFDRCCTHHPVIAHPGDERMVNVDGALAVCPFDSSEFIIVNGSGIPTKGPAELPLRTYTVSINGTHLIIRN